MIKIEIDKAELQSRIEDIIKIETYVSNYGGCSCSYPELEDVDDAAREIVKLVEKLLTPLIADDK